MLTRPLPRSLIVALLLACSLGVARAEDAVRPTIEATGESTVSAKPDYAMIVLGVQSNARNAQAALADNSKTTANLIETLKAAGIESKDIQTSDFSIWPQVSNVGRAGGDPTTIVGYSVSNHVRTTIRDVTKLGEILDRAVTAGANSVNGIHFGIANSSALLDEARKAAFADAKRKAELYASEAGVKLAGIASLEETGAGPAPFAVSASLERASVPIEAGESKLTIGVRVRFDIAK